MGSTPTRLTQSQHPEGRSVCVGDFLYFLYQSKEISEYRLVEVVEFHFSNGILCSPMIKTHERGMLLLVKWQLSNRQPQFYIVELCNLYYQRHGDQQEVET